MKKLWKSFVLIVPVVLLVLAIVFSNVPIKRNEKSNENLKDPGDSQGIVWAGAADTGAASASKTYKGGAIFLEPNTSYTMTGGTISNHSNTYGGAIFISSGATFTMTGGTIKSCSASYGGGIYVSAGATCNITAGTITGCSASVAGPAIYVEEGGTLNLGEGANVSDSDIYKDKNVSVEISDDTLALGNPSSNVKLHYTYFGSYPQSHVTDSSLISQLNNLKSGSPVDTYTCGSRSWNAYEHSDGNIYVFGTGKGYDSNSLYKDGASVSSSGDWFKVEPIKWFVLNYDSKGSEGYELLSELVLTASVPFNPSTSDGNSWSTSNIRKFCNGEFLNKAFTSAEQELINTTTVKNNMTGSYSSSTSDRRGPLTEDKIYLKSYYEVDSGYFTSDAIKLAAPSDFCVANYVGLSSSGRPTAHRTDRACSWWLRSAGSSASHACYVHFLGYGSDYYEVTDEWHGVRPALTISL